MSKRFKAQDHFRYKRLGKRWRRPVGWQSKLRIRKGGSGLKVSIGYGSPAVSRGKVNGATVTLVHNAGELMGINSGGAARIASGVGALKTRLIEAKAKEMSIRIVNMKKVRRARKIVAAIDKRRDDRKKAAKEKAKKEEKPGKPEEKPAEDKAEQKNGEQA